MQHTAESISARLLAMGNPDSAALSLRFFKTGPGEYAEGDKFAGLELRDLNALVKETWKDTPLTACCELLQSEWHECRTTALAIMEKKYERGTEAEREQIFDAYLANTARINNWDLVDMSASHIVGPWLETRDRSILYTLAKSKLLWERRIAIISTLHYIKKDDFNDTLKIAEMLLNDKQDLMHKATGWMLREVGKRNEKTLCGFLDVNARKMPRTALRYAIEKMEPERRKYYMTLR